MSDEFFVGWSGKPPKSYASKGKQFFFGCLILCLLIGVLFVTNQEKYIDSEYEYGILQERTGHLVENPVWGLRVEEEGKIVTIPIVGFGKMGPYPTLTKMMETHDLKEGTRVTLRGMLTHYQEKYLMELTEGENSLVAVGELTMLAKKIEMKGQKTLEGEIVDPKCFFGVMNPAFKAVHRSCAIRCISGGMPPLLAIRENGAFVDYYFIHGEGMKSITNEILPYIGIPVKVSGQVFRYDDWNSIVIDPADLQIAHRDMDVSPLLVASICN